MSSDIPDKPQGSAKSKASTGKSAKKSKSKPQWLKRHFDDFYVKEAQKKGYRSRAVFKLQEIQEKDHILHRGDIVVDLGAAPGGWSQLAREYIGPTGHIIAADILPMESLDRVDFVQGDFTEPEVLEKILSLIGERRVQLVMSDMAPNISGVRAVDQPRSMYLAELALDLAQNVLSKDGDFLTKIFQGEGFDEYFKALKTNFTKVLTRKPKASRSNSREVYLLARGYKGT